MAHPEPQHALPGSPQLLSASAPPWAPAAEPSTFHPQSPSAIRDSCSSPTLASQSPSSAALFYAPAVSAGSVDMPASGSGPPLPAPLPHMEAAAILQGHPELQALLMFLPTKQDLDSLASDLKSAWRRDLGAVQSDVSSLQTQVADLVSFKKDSQKAIADLQIQVAQQTSHSQTLQSQLDDLENRNRRNNIRLRGLPETVRTADLLPTLLRIFNKLLGKPPDTHIEIDRAHRALRPLSSDPANPRDVICRVHYYSVKEQIMQKSRLLSEVDFDGVKLKLFPDLSRRTLRLRALLRPLLSLLQARNIPYRWGFPFALHVRSGDVSATLRTLQDLPALLQAFDLPEVILPDWNALPVDFPAATPEVPTTSQDAGRRQFMSPRPQRSRRRQRSMSRSGD